MGVKKAVAQLLPAAEKARDLRLDADKKVRLLEIEFSILKHNEESFDRAMSTVNKKLCFARVKCATLL